MAKASILIVEDEAIVAADLADKLERAGYAIAGTLSRGEQAVRMVRQNRPDLILMDIRLAGPLDGNRSGGVFEDVYGRAGRIPDGPLGRPDDRARGSHRSVRLHPQTVRRAGS
jgi:hypothetical protein